MRRDAWVVLWLWAVGYLLWPWRFVRRWWLRLRLRRKMRRLGMFHVIVAALGAAVPNLGTAQAVDTVFTAPWVSDVLGSVATQRVAVYCIERAADWGSLVVIASIARVNPDTLRGYPCPDPRRADGASLPVLWDMIECPAYAPPIGRSPFIFARCEGRWFRFPPRASNPDRKAQ